MKGFRAIQENTGGGGGAVDSVNGQTGVVVLDTSDIAEDTNLYYTDERAQDAVGGILTSQFIYTDATPEIAINNALVLSGSAGDSKLTITESSALATTRELGRLTNNGGVSFALEDTSATQVYAIRNVGTSLLFVDVTNTATRMSISSAGVITINTGFTGLIRADSGVLSVDSDVTDVVAAASDTAAGKVELAIASEVTTGTDATRAVTPDALAGSTFGKRIVEILLLENDVDAEVVNGIGNIYWTAPTELAGYNIVNVAASVATAGTTGTLDIQIHNVTSAADILTTKITIDSGQTTSYTAATPAVISGTEDDLTAGDLFRFDIDAIHTTPSKGLTIILTAQLP